MNHYLRFLISGIITGGFMWKVLTLHPVTDGTDCCIAGWLMLLVYLLINMIILIPEKLSQ